MPKFMEKVTKDIKNLYIDSYNEKYVEKEFSTRSVHIGQPPDSFYGSVNVPKYEC